MVKRYAGISFHCSRRIYCFEIGALHLKVNDDVVVETDRGVNMGKVVVPPETATLPDGLPEAGVKKVLRKARDDDFEKSKENSVREIEVAKVCHDKIESYRLKMKLVRAEFMHDGNRVIFYFTAENRVDFRELVKDLAHTLHVRVEMRQIGIRDAAGMLGGVGICGRELCCSAFLSTFAPVTVKMAKEQNLALNPMKISGICGRLMCCLGYEYENYSKTGGLRKSGGRRRSGKSPDAGSGNRGVKDNKDTMAGKEDSAVKDKSSRNNPPSKPPLKSPSENPEGKKDPPKKGSGSRKYGKKGSRSGKGPRGDKNRAKRQSSTS